MLASLIIAAAIHLQSCTFTNVINATHSYEGRKWESITNASTGKVRFRRKRPAPKPREDLTPVEAWHRFCRPDGKVEIPKDERPKPYSKEKPNPHERKPRK